MNTQLQELLNEFGCNILNYTNNKIFVDHFYSEERYNDFLNGLNCRGGQGLFDTNEDPIVNKLNDNILVIKQKNGIEIARYKYIPFFKATLEYKELDSNNKKVNRKLTFTVRKEQYTGIINFVTEETSLDFYNIKEVKDYLNQKYGPNKLTDWSVIIG